MSEQYGDILVKNGTLVTVDSTNTIIENGAVLIRDGSIKKILEPGEVDGVKADTEIDADNCIVMPGLVNAHTHLPMSLFRGLADDMELMTWLNEYIFPAEGKHINPESVTLGSLLSCAEMLLSGTTTCCDGYFHEDQAAEAILSSGMRGVAAHGVIDYPAPGVPDPSENVKTAAEFVDRWKSRHPTVSPSIFCHSPYTCSPETLVGAKRAASDQGVLFQIHMAETKGETEQVQASHGKSPAAFLHELGILDKDTLIHHAVWVDENDSEIIIKSGASISHNPESNMKLSSGVAPIPGFISGGVRVGLGTDGGASNNNLDLFSEMDTAAKLHKVTTLNPVVMDAVSVLHMATVGGAKAIGLGELTGTIETGKKADLIILDTDKPHLVPMYNPVSHIVYSAGGADVRDVIVDGKVVVRNREILTFDLRDILDRAKGFGRMVAGE